MHTHFVFPPLTQVAQTTILPKGKILDEASDIKSVMLSAESKKNAYYFDYTVTPPNLPEVRRTSKAIPSFHVRTNHRFVPIIY